MLTDSKTVRMLTILLAFAAAGCTRLDLGVTSDQPAWGEGYSGGDDALARARTRRLAKALAAWQDQSAPDTTDYQVGAGDVLEISVFALERPGELSVLRRAVPRQGTIALPWVGGVQATGLSTAQIEQAVASAYADKYLKNPQVAVRVAEYRSTPVVVTGAVSQPGLYHLTTNRSTVLECLALAGGLGTTAGDELFVVRGGNGATSSADAARAAVQTAASGTAALADPGKETLVVDLRELIDKGNLLVNGPVMGGDVVIVPPVPRKYIYVLGYVRNPGAFAVEDGASVDAVRAVAMSGGLAPIGRAANCHLLRQTANGEDVVPVDLKQIARGELPPLYLRPGDTLVVGTSTWGRISEFLAPSMGASLSASASVVP